MLAVRFLHYLGVAMWIGGGIAVAVMALSAEKESPTVQAHLFTKLAHVHTGIIGIGVILTLGTGILWSMSLVSASGATSDPVPVAFWVMVLLGFAGGAIVLFGAMPTAVRLGRLAAAPAEDGELHQACKRFGSRLSILSTLASVLAVASLLASVAAT